MIRRILILLAITVTAYGQQIRGIDLHSSAKDTINAVIGRSPGFTVDVNSKAVVSSSFLADSLVAADTTALKLRKGASDGAMIYLAGLSGTNSNGGGWFIQKDSTELENGTVAYANANAGKQWIRNWDDGAIRTSWAGANNTANDIFALRKIVSTVQNSSGFNLLLQDCAIYLADSLEIYNCDIVGNGETWTLALTDSTKSGIVIKNDDVAYVQNADITNINMVATSECFALIRSYRTLDIRIHDSILNGANYADYCIFDKEYTPPGHPTWDHHSGNFGVVSTSTWNAKTTIYTTSNIAYMDDIDVMAWDHVGVYFGANGSIHKSRIQNGDSVCVYADMQSGAISVLNLYDVYFEHDGSYDIYIKNAGLLTVQGGRIYKGVYADTCRLVSIGNVRVPANPVFKTTAETKQFALYNSYGLIPDLDIIPSFIPANSGFSQLDPSTALYFNGNSEYSWTKVENVINYLWSDTSYIGNMQASNAMFYGNTTFNSDTLHLRGNANYLIDSDDFGYPNWNISGTPDPLSLTEDIDGTVDSIGIVDATKSLSLTTVGIGDEVLHDYGYYNMMVEAKKGTGDIKIRLTMGISGYAVGSSRPLYSDTLTLTNDYQRFSVTFRPGTYQYGLKDHTVIWSIDIVDGKVNGNGFYVKQAQIRSAQDTTQFAGSFGTRRYYGNTVLVTDTLNISGTLKPDYLTIGSATVDSSYEAATNDTLYYRIKGTSRWYYMLIKP